MRWFVLLGVTYAHASSQSAPKAADDYTAVVDIAGCKLGISRANGPDVLTSSCSLAGPPEHDLLPALASQVAMLQSRMAALEALLTPPSPPPPLAPAHGTEALPAASCVDVSATFLPGVVYIGEKGSSRQVYCNAEGWALIATNRLGGQSSGPDISGGLNGLDRSNLFWAGQFTDRNERFTLDGQTEIKVKYLANAIGTIPFTKLKIDYGGAEATDVLTFPSSSTLPEKRSAGEEPTTAIDHLGGAHHYRWNFSPGRCFTTMNTCLLCRARGTCNSNSDTSLDGLAVHATQISSHSCEAAASNACRGISSDCGVTFPIGSVGHRGNGNQNCDNAAWIK